MITGSYKTLGVCEKSGGVTYDSYLEKMGNYFVYYNLRERYGWTFEHFLGMLERGSYTVENGY